MQIVTTKETIDIGEAYTIQFQHGDQCTDAYYLTKELLKDKAEAEELVLECITQAYDLVGESETAEVLKVQAKNIVKQAIKEIKED